MSNAVLAAAKQVSRQTLHAASHCHLLITETKGGGLLRPPVIEAENNTAITSTFRDLKRNGCHGECFNEFRTILPRLKVQSGQDAGRPSRRAWLSTLRNLVHRDGVTCSPICPRS